MLLCKGNDNQRALFCATTVLRNGCCAFHSKRDEPDVSSKLVISEATILLPNVKQTFRKCLYTTIFCIYWFFLAYCWSPPVSSGTIRGMHRTTWWLYYMKFTWKISVSAFSKYIFFNFHKYDFKCSPTSVIHIFSRFLNEIKLPLSSIKGEIMW